jgi:hypothetical protein
MMGGASYVGRSPFEFVERRYHRQVNQLLNKLVQDATKLAAKASTVTQSSSQISSQSASAEDPDEPLLTKCTTTKVLVSNESGDSTFVEVMLRIRINRGRAGKSQVLWFQRDLLPTPLEAGSY